MAKEQGKGNEDDHANDHPDDEGVLISPTLLLRFGSLALAFTHRCTLLCSLRIS